MVHTQSQLVSVVIPVLNEADNISPLVGRLFASTRELGASIEIVFVDDGSTDGTRSRIEEYRDHGLRVLERTAERGLATAVIHGAKVAHGDVVLVMDGDLSHPPEMVGDLVRPILEHRADLVLGSRYLPGGTIIGWPVHRALVSRLATALSRRIVRVTDPLSGFFALKKTLLLQVPESAIMGFKIGLEILGRFPDLRVLEVPIEFRERTAGRSKLNLQVTIQFLRQFVRLWRFRSNAAVRASKCPPS